MKNNLNFVCVEQAKLGGAPVWVQAANMKPLLKQTNQNSLTHLVKMFSEDDDDIENNHSSKLTLCLLYARSCFKHFIDLYPNDPNDTSEVDTVIIPAALRKILRQREVKKLAPGDTASK